MSRRIVITTLCFLAMTGATLHSGENSPGFAAPAAFVTVGKVTETENVETRRYTGHVTSSASVSLIARVSGELLGLGFEEGDFVHRGQVLAELDSVRYEADVKNIEAKIAESKARLSYAAISYNRNAELFEKKAISKDAMDSSESEHEAYKAALLAAEAQLITARDDLKNTRIVAPIDGKIGVTNFTAGNYLTPSSGVIATIIQVDPLRVSFAISSRDFLAMFGTVDRLKANADIRLRLADDSIYEYGGSVEFIDNQANLRTDTVQVYAKFENPDGKLIPGATVTVLLSRRNGGYVPAVAPSAIMHDEQSAYVYVVDGENKVERRDVELGAAKTGLQLISSGLRTGELVVTDGMHKTMPGAVIEPDYQG